MRKDKKLTAISRGQWRLTFSGLSKAIVPGRGFFSMERYVHCDLIFTTGCPKMEDLRGPDVTGAHDAALWHIGFDGGAIADARASADANA